MKDYQKAHSGSTGNFGSSWEGNKDLISGSYQKY